MHSKDWPSSPNIKSCVCRPAIECQNRQGTRIYDGMCCSAHVAVITPLRPSSLGLIVLRLGPSKHRTGRIMPNPAQSVADRNANCRLPTFRPLSLYFWSTTIIFHPELKASDAPQHEPYLIYFCGCRVRGFSMVFLCPSSSSNRALSVADLFYTRWARNL